MFYVKRCSYKFHKVQRRTPVPKSLFINKVVGLRPATLLKKRPWYRHFPVNFLKFIRTPCLQNSSGRLLLFFITSFLFTFSVIVWELILSNKQIFDTRVILAERHLWKQVSVFIFLYKNMLMKYFFKDLLSVKNFSRQKKKKHLLKFQKSSLEYLPSKTFLLTLQPVFNLKINFSPPHIFSAKVFFKAGCIKTCREN